jgi:gentisate 1,2-dioxygenase
VNLAAKEIAAFDDELKAVHLFGQWNAEAALAKLTDGPRPAGTPMVWPYDVVRAKLDEACVLFPESMSARRNVTFITPGLPRRGSTPTIIAGMQLVLPGEIASAHRHSIAALRFVVEGATELYTVVDGRRQIMETHDLIFTPSYSYHDHHNESAATGVWLDVLDVPLIAALNQTFYEPLAERVQTLDESKPSPRMRFSWSEMSQALRAAGSGGPDTRHGVRVAYSALSDEPNLLSSLACFAQVLPPGFSGVLHRHTPSAVYYVVSGHGCTEVGDARLDWSGKATFTVPGWAPHRFANASNTEEAVLFSVTDEPLLAALGLLRAEAFDA